MLCIRDDRKALLDDLYNTLNDIRIGFQASWHLGYANNSLLCKPKPLDGAEQSDTVAGMLSLRPCLS
jgi:hypothetical protein